MFEGSDQVAGPLYITTTEVQEFRFPYILNQESNFLTFSASGELSTQVLSHFFIRLLVFLFLSFPFFLGSTLIRLSPSSFHRVALIRVTDGFLLFQVQWSIFIPYCIVLTATFKEGPLFLLEMLSSLSFLDTIISLFFSASIAGLSVCS